MDIAPIVISGLGIVAFIWLVAALFLLAAWHYRGSTYRADLPEGKLRSAGEVHLQDIKQMIAEIDTQVGLRRLRSFEKEAGS